MCFAYVFPFLKKTKNYNSPNKTNIVAINLENVVRSKAVGTVLSPGCRGTPGLRGPSLRNVDPRTNSLLPPPLQR